MTQRLDYAAAAPAGMRLMAQLHAHVAKSGLDPVMVELVYLRASILNGCAYCIDMHARSLSAEGVPIEKVVLVPVWREAQSLFTTRERAALAWTESVTCVAETNVPDEEFQAARAVFDVRELVELTIAISLINAYNRVAVSFRTTPQATKSKLIGTLGEPDRKVTA